MTEKTKEKTKYQLINGAWNEFEKKKIFLVDKLKKDLEEKLKKIRVKFEKCGK